jgi:hypothetical protein
MLKVLVIISPKFCCRKMHVAQVLKKEEKKRYEKNGQVSKRIKQWVL